MPSHLLSSLIYRASLLGLVEEVELQNARIQMRLLGDWVDMDATAALNFLQTIIQIEEESRSRTVSGQYL